MNTLESDCWLWARSHSSKGYGFWTTLMNGKRKYAHVVMYEVHNGDIPEGYQIDHLCRVTRCINPEHLEAVTPLTNILRSKGVAAINATKTECNSGHQLEGRNLYTHKKTGKRHCLACNKLRKAEYRSRQNA